jgi:hypothetical protein
LVLGAQPLIGASPAGALSTAELAWSQLSPSTSPPARQGAAVAFDPATAQLVLFGGLSASGNALDDTWTWDGTTWSQTDDSGDSGCTSSCTSSPPARQGAAVAFDPATAQLVLSGGLSASGNALDDTWTWNGTTWSQTDDSGDSGCTSSCTSSPPALQGASLAYDPASAQLVLFGGYDGTNEDNGTWTWNGTTWAQTDDSGYAGCTNACPSSPTGRQSGVLAYDPATAQLVLFGGLNASDKTLDDTWTWNGATWAQTDDSGSAGCTTSCPSSPPALDQAGSDFDPAIGELVVFGGNDGTNNDNGTWTWNGATWSQIDDSGSPGCTTGCPSSPSGRAGAALIYDTASAQLLVFGGAGPSTDADTWDLVPPSPTSTGWAQVNATANATARFTAVMAYDPATAQLVLFGGLSSTQYNSTWTWNGTTWAQVDDSGSPGCTNSCPSSPLASYSSAMAFDPATGQLVLFGGNGPGGSYNDTWTWNGTIWSQVSDAGDAGCGTTSNPCPSSPGGRQGPTMAYDLATAQLVLFGGDQISGGVVYNDTWTWNGTTWAQVDDSGDAGCTATCTSSPPGRQAGSLVYDPAKAQLVLFGGDYATGFYNDTWIWNGTTWAQGDDSSDAGCTTTCTSSPPARFRIGADYDQATGQLVLFGGSSSAGSFNDTWTWTGTIWSQTSDSGSSGCTNACPQSPSARSGPSVAFDPASGQLVLFGGSGTSTLNDTWDWDYSALVLTPTSVSWSPTLNGYDQTLSTPVTIEVANEGSGGWDLTIQASASFGAGFTSAVNGSSLSAQANTAPSQSCAGSCVAASTNTVTYPVTVASSALNLYTAAAGSGVGDLDLSTDWWLTVPAKARAGTTTVTYTLTLSYGP